MLSVKYTTSFFFTKKKLISMLRMRKNQQDIDCAAINTYAKHKDSQLCCANIEGQMTKANGGYLGTWSDKGRRNWRYALGSQ